MLGRLHTGPSDRRPREWSRASPVKIGVDRPGALEIQARLQRPHRAAPPGSRPRSSHKRDRPSARPTMASKRAQLGIDGAARVGRVERLGKPHLVPIGSSREVALSRMFCLGVHREQATDHAAFPGARQIEMALLGAHEKIAAAFAVLNEVLGRVIVAVEDRDFAALLHTLLLLAASSTGRAQRNRSFSPQRKTDGFRCALTHPTQPAAPPATSRC